MFARALLRSQASAEASGILQVLNTVVRNIPGCSIVFDLDKTLFERARLSRHLATVQHQAHFSALAHIPEAGGVERFVALDAHRLTKQLWYSGFWQRPAGADGVIGIFNQILDIVEHFNRTPCSSALEEA